MNVKKLIAVAAVAASAMAAHGRSLIHYFDFDTMRDGNLAYTDVDKGTSPADFTLKQNGTTYASYTSGALGSDHAFYSSSKTSLWLGDDSTSLGCGTIRGFTLSFWCKLSASHTVWSDFFGFRVGGRCYRFEYTTKNSSQFTFYSSTSDMLHPDTGEVLKYSGATANVWHHFAIVATPNGTNSIGTCAFFVDGGKVANLALRAAGDLQQINIGTWQREGNGNDRTYNANNTGIDELAVFDYPATVEQVKWLAKYKPAQPTNGPGREMPYCWHFDTTNKTFGATAKVNSGTGTKVAFLWGDEKENNPGVNTTGNITAPSTNSALGTAYAMNAGNRATWRVADSAGLGPTVGSGFTFSFWMRGNARPVDWTDCFTFGIS